MCWSLLFLFAAAVVSGHPTHNLLMWGGNTYGQLGVNTSKPYSALPVLTPLNHTCYALSMGDGWTGCLTASGQLFMWGYGGNGVLGDGSTANSPTPQHVPITCEQLALGIDMSGCLTPSRVLYMWGDNYAGGLGDGSYIASSKPLPILTVPWGEACVQLAIGYSYAGCVTNGGYLLTWGSNQYGRLGDGTTVDHSTPTAIDLGVPGQNCSTVVMGLYTAGCITTQGGLFMWGRNNFGQVGDGTTTDRYKPVQVFLPGNATCASLSIGGYFAGCRTNSGAVYLWGTNRWGQLGDNFAVSQALKPQLVPGITCYQLELAFATAGCLAPNGTLFTWGSNEVGQIGDGTNFTRYQPTMVHMPMGHSCLELSSNYQTFGCITHAPKPPPPPLPPKCSKCGFATWNGTQCHGKSTPRVPVAAGSVCSEVAVRNQVVSVELGSNCVDFVVYNGTGCKAERLIGTYSPNFCNSYPVAAVNGSFALWCTPS